MGADRVLWRVDGSARRAYELRAAHSEPGLESASAPPELTEASR
jgi:hypothetical protein